MLALDNCKSFRRVVGTALSPSKHPRVPHRLDTYAMFDERQLVGEIPVGARLNAKRPVHPPIFPNSNHRLRGSSGMCILAIVQTGG